MSTGIEGNLRVITELIESKALLDEGIIPGTLKRWLAASTPRFLPITAMQGPLPNLPMGP